MKRLLSLLALFMLLFMTINSQRSSLLILGDIHYNLLGDHDMEWLKTKPDDYRQVTQEYTVSTEQHWDDFMTVLKGRILTANPPIKAVLQTGDLSQGLAGNEHKAMQMARNTMKAVENAAFPVPWIISKGNHDITGPGGREAFDEYYLPMIRRQTQNYNITSANYSYSFGDVQVTVIDPYDRTIDIVEFLKNELSNSDAKIKIVSSHEPVIPVTERCWHILRREPERREKLLEVIAKNNAIVFCGHLHRYAVVSRNTDHGPIVQVMINSVVRDRNYKEPSTTINEYGPSLAEARATWQPETLEARKAMLAEESKHVTFYKQNNLPGYVILDLNEGNGNVRLEYYPAFGSKPHDKIDLSALMNK